MSNYLAVDLGASSYRIVLSDGEQLTELYRSSDHLETIDGVKYWNITVIYNSLIDCLSTLSNNEIKVKSLAVDSFGCDFVDMSQEPQFDDFGKLTNRIRGNCYLNIDRTATFDKLTNEQLFELTGIINQPFNTINRFKQITKPLTFVASYINYLLTGYVEVDCTIASTTQLLDKVSDHYNLEVLKAIQVDVGLLPPLAVGKTTIRKIRHKSFNNIDVIFGAGHDTAYALNHGDSNSLILNVGSWVILGANIESVNNYLPNYSYERGIKSKYKVVINQVGMNGYNQLIAENKLSISHRDINEQLNTVAKYYHLDDKDIEPTNYIQDPNWQVNIASYLNDIARLSANNITKFIQDINPSIDNIYIVGGGSRNKFYIDKLLKYLPTNLKVEFGEQEATVMGNIKFQKELDNGITR